MSVSKRTMLAAVACCATLAGCESTLTWVVEHPSQAGRVIDEAQRDAQYYSRSRAPGTTPSTTVAEADTFLCEAANRSNLSSASKLLAEGANVNAQCRPLSMGLPAGLTTPLHVASFKDAAGVAELLLDHGANINAKNKNGGTPLHVAAATGSADVVTLLLARGAKVNAKDQLGRTPLHEAVFKDHADVVKLLLAHGAATNIEDNYGMTPTRLATDPQVVELLK